MKKLITLLFLMIPIFIFSQNLTGVWNCDDGATYYIRQVDNNIWWYGDGGSNFTNVFQGVIIDDWLAGEWADVPKGSDRNHGSLGIKIMSKNRLERVNEDGGFSGKVWTRNENTQTPSGDCFEYFPNKAIPGYNKKVMSGTVEECKKECLKHDWCKSFDYSPNANKCYLQTANRFDFGKLNKSNSYDHYHNKCWKE